MINNFTDYNFSSTSSDMFIPAEDVPLSSGPVWHGTTIGWDRKLDPFTKKMPHINERFCGVKYSDGVKLMAISAYLPTSGNDEEFLEVLTSLTVYIRENLENDEMLIIGLDSNQSVKSTRRRSNAMHEFCNQFTLKTITPDGVDTFHHNNMTSSSRIDHILYFIPDTNRFEMNLHSHLCTLTHSSNLSSHDVIVGNLQFERRKTSDVEADYSHTYLKFDVKKPVWNSSNLPEYQALSYNIVKYLSENFNEDEHIPLLSELCSTMLVKAAEKSLPLKPVPKVARRNFFSQRHKVAYEEHEKVCREWRNLGRPTEKTHPARIAKLLSQRKLQKIAREEEASRAQSNHERLMNNFYNNTEELHRILRNIRGERQHENTIPFLNTLSGTYSGENILEGFCANTEALCVQDTEKLNHEFYKMCQVDNFIIFEIAKQESVRIPDMTLADLKIILFHKLKLRKACDIHKLTVEHLRFLGDDTLLLILEILNSIIRNINYLSSYQLNTAIASIIYKGKGKVITEHKSYRQVRVSPLISRIIDEHIRPNLVKIAKSVQNRNQYGFTANMSYMLGALQRNEVEKFCLDTKKTFFCCSLDGEAAFEVVNRTIQLRELYCAGEVGQFWMSSKHSYDNTQTQIKYQGKLSRNITEYTGVKQGNIRSSDHYKIYLSSLLDTVDSANLGVSIGPVNVGQSACADDELLITDSQTKLQALLDIAEHYGVLFHSKYGASKTKITIIGSEIDQQYYKELSPWRLDGHVVTVSEDNEHLGQIISNRDQEQKNVDLRIQKTRNCIFGMLGPAFQFKCLLSPIVKFHIFRTYICPVLRSGLSSFVLRDNHIKPITIFHRKILRGILNFSKSSNVAPLHFLLGELPIEGQIHRDIFSLFHSVWTNPDTKIHEIVKYLLQTSSMKSRTWSVHVRSLSMKYGIADPLECLNSDAPAMSAYKEHIITKITAYHEKELRQKANTNSRMKYLNVSLLSLRGRQHPALLNIVTPHEVQKSRIHLKMLSGDFLTYEIKALHSGGSPHCRICIKKMSIFIIESTEHIITSCEAFDETRTRIFPQYDEALQNSESKLTLNDFASSNEILCQFLLDPTSINLKYRLREDDPILKDIFNLSRDLCRSISNERTNIIQSLADSK